MDINYDRLSGSLGSLLLIWAALERSLREEVIRAHGFLPARAYGIAAVMRTWESVIIDVHPPTSLGPLLAKALRHQLQAPLDIRNGLCHGLIGISTATKNRPAELRWEIHEKKHSISWDGLQQQFGWLSKLPHAVSIISNPSMTFSGSRTTNTSENREWWRSEFALDLPEA